MVVTFKSCPVINASFLIFKRDLTHKIKQRSLWIARINAAAHANGLSYSKFMHGLKLANIDLNRKSLAEIAVSDATTFAKLAETAKANLK